MWSWADNATEQKVELEPYRLRLAWVCLLFLSFPFF